MKTMTICLTVMLSLGAYAKAATETLMTVTLPENAMMGKVALPAGEYKVRELWSGPDAGILEFYASSGRVVNVLVSDIDAPGNHQATHSSVVLRLADGKLQLDKVWIEGQERGFQLLTSGAR